MTRSKTALFVAAATAAITAALPAQAAVTFTVNGTFTTQQPGTGNAIPQGTLTGTFTTNDALTTVTAFALTASPSATFIGFDYTNASGALIQSSVTASSLPGTFFQLNDTSGLFELRLIFAQALGTATTIAFNPTSYESEFVLGSRFLSGSVTRQSAAVPEPTAWAMLILGMGAVGYSLRRRRAVMRLA